MYLWLQYVMTRIEIETRLYTTRERKEIPPDYLVTASSIAIASFHSMVKLTKHQRFKLCSQFRQVRTRDALDRKALKVTL